MTVCVSDGWTKTVTPRVTARGRGEQPPIVTARRREGVTQNRDPAVQRELRKSAHYGYTVRC